MKNPSHLKSQDLENAAYFDQWAKSYDKGRITKWFQYTQELAINAMTLSQNSRVLDVGCGTGHAVLALAARLPEGKACGIDISAEMVEEAQTKIPPLLAERTEFRRASSESIPYLDGFFDGVLCTNSFHHYPDPIKALKEMQRVLKPGGQIVIFENATDLSWYTWCWDKILRLLETGHVKYYTSHELGVLLRASGVAKAELLCLKNERFKYGKVFASIQLWRAQKSES